MLEKNPLFIVPKNQVQRIPGMINNDTCNFDIFLDATKPHRSIKKDIQMFLKSREVESTNIKLPNLEGNKSMFRPHKHMQPVENS